MTPPNVSTGSGYPLIININYFDYFRTIEGTLDANFPFLALFIFPGYLDITARVNIEILKTFFL